MPNGALCLMIPVFLCATALSLSAQWTIMPLGDSITAGAGVAGGYRDPLAADLAKAGIAFHFVGAADTGPTPGLVKSGNQHHNGYGAWPIEALTANLDADKQYMIGGKPYGDGNQGGYWLTGIAGGRGPEHPDIVLLEIGTNNFLMEQGKPVTEFEKDIAGLVTGFQKLSPRSHILVAGAIPINNNAGFNAEITKYDSYIQDTLAPSQPATTYVNLYAVFTRPDGSTIPALYQADNIHPSAQGYSTMAAAWTKAIQQDLQKAR